MFKKKFFEDGFVSNIAILDKNTAKKIAEEYINFNSRCNKRHLSVEHKSIIHLKPLMTFGYSWLNKFKYCINIRTKKNISRAIKIIEENKINFSEKDVKIFLKSLEETSYNIYHASALKFEENVIPTEEENKNQIYNAIIDHYNNWV